MTTLLFTSGPMAGRRIELSGELVLGREGVHLIVEDAEVSRRHAAVRPRRDGAEIEDLGSLNGTWVNGRRITGPTHLADGDRIRLGVTQLQLEVSAGAESGPPGAAPSLPGPSLAGPSGTGAPAGAPPAAGPSPHPAPASGQRSGTALRPGPDRAAGAPSDGSLAGPPGPASPRAFPAPVPPVDRADMPPGSAAAAAPPHAPPRPDHPAAVPPPPDPDDAGWFATPSAQSPEEPQVSGVPAPPRGESPAAWRSAPAEAGAPRVNWLSATSVTYAIVIATALALLAYFLFR